MKLIIAIIQDEDTDSLINVLSENQYRVTRLSSTGGFLKNGNTILLIGIEDNSVDDVLSHIGNICKVRKIQTVPITNTDDFLGIYSSPIEVTVGGATVFVLDVDRFEKYI